MVFIELKISSDQDLKAKQELLEKSLKNLWELELNEYFKNMKSLNNNGISLLIEVLSILSKDLDSLFNNNKIMARKDYLKPIACLEHSNIISICLSKVLPFIVLNSDNSEQQVTTLCESIGLLLYKEVIKKQYKDSLSSDPSLIISYKEYFHKNNTYSNEDAIRLGLFILTFISEKNRFILY